ncbi:MAG TPA: hypothetical protein VIC85_12515 [Ktedonobacterales bacterium]
MAGPAVVFLTVMALLAVTVFTGLGRTTAAADPQNFAGSLASPQVRTVIRLGSPDFHPRQLAYDPLRNGIWFWTSTQDHGITFTNRVYYYDIERAQLRSWPIYSGDWSSQLHAGLAVDQKGDVWIGWNHHLVDFRPADGSYVRYEIPARATYPLPAAVIRDLPADLGITDVAVGKNGTIWIARYGALSLTSFSPTNRTFSEHALPPNAGDPAKIAIGPDGHVFFITNLSADHPGYGAEKVGEFDPRSGSTVVTEHGALSLAVTARGDVYTGLSLRAFGLGRLSASERANAHAQSRAPKFQEQLVPFDIDDRAVAVDGNGRVWVAVGGRPEIAVLSPASGRIQVFQYAAPAITSWPAWDAQPGIPRTTPKPGAVWLSHIVAMVTDKEGHLWYVREGSSNIEEVVA